MKKFRSSLEKPGDTDWRLRPTSHEPKYPNHRSDEEPVIHQDFERVSPKRIRGRTRTTESNVVTEKIKVSPPVLSETPAINETLKKHPVVRIRSNNNNGQKSNGINRNGTLVRVVKTRISSDGTKEIISGQNTTSTTTTKKPIASNHKTESEVNKSTTPNGRRIRVRLVEGNANKNDASTTQAPPIKNSSKREPSRESDDDDSDEPNYPEHFKALLRYKKPLNIVDPNDRRIPPKKFASTASPIVTTLLSSTQSTATASNSLASSTTVSNRRTPPTQKRIARPSKLMFPSLYKPNGTIEREILAKKQIGSSSASTTARKIQPKYSSKIRNMETVPPSVSKMRVITTGSDEGLEITSYNDSTLTEQKLHHLNAVSTFFFPFRSICYFG